MTSAAETEPGNSRRFDTGVLIYKSKTTDQPAWIAQTTKYNLLAWGEDPKEAWESLNAVIAVAILDDLNCGFNSANRPDAPQDIQQRFSKAQDFPVEDHSDEDLRGFLSVTFSLAKF